MLIKFLQYLKLRGVSSASLKYYKSDITNFINWAGEREITAKLIREYIKAQTFTSPKTTINRRLSTLRSYSQFLGRNFMLGVNNVTDIKSVQAPEIKVSKTSAYRFLQEKILARFERKPRVQNAFFKLFFVRPNWYKTYHTYPIASYIHIAILVLFTSLSGYALYDQVFKNPENPLAFPTALTRPNRYMSFQGRLTSNVGNPITVATNVVFKLYTASTAGTELWSSGTCSITPDQDGIFSTLLGSSCGAEIAATVFSENASVWVGVTVAADAEATPRIQIATVAYALNTETLQGYPAGTGTSTIPYIGSTGILVLANASPTIQSTSGTFAVEGLAMTISTPNTSNGVITVNPDGVGTLDLTFEGAAAGLSANGFVNATNANITSGALYGGTVASAETGYNFIDFQGGVSPASKFSVSAVGDTTMAGDLLLSGGNLNTGNIAFTVGDATTDSITLTTDGTGNAEIVLPNDSIGPNEIFATGQTDEYCLTYEGTGTTWEWQTCSGGGTMSSFILAGDSGDNQTIADGNTASILGGTNGIDTVGSATDTLTLNLDTTEIGTNTFGGGSAITWTFDASAGTDTTLAFGDNTITASVLAVTGTLTANGQVDLGDGGDIITISGSDTNIIVIDGSTINLDGDGSPTADLLQIGSSDTSITAGVDGLFINLAMSNTSGDSIHITPAFAGGAADTLTYNIIEADAFTPTNAAGTDTINGIKLGNLTEGADAARLTSTAINIGTGWDNLLSYNGTPVINGSGQIISTQINGTLFSNSSDSNAGTNTIVQSDTLTISGGTNGIDTSLSNDTYTLNLDTTEIGTNTFGSGSAITWTFDASAGTDTTIAFGDNLVTLTTATTALSGNLKVTGGNILNSEGNGTIAFSATPAAIDSYHVLANGSWLVENMTNNGIAALMVNQTKAGDLFTASASGVPKFTITNAGNVGIGTVAPINKLTVDAGSGLPNATYATTVANSSLAINDAGVSSLAMMFGVAPSTPATWIQNQYSGSEVTAHLLLNPIGGNVGIGTTAPGAKLDVYYVGGAPAVSGTTQNGVARFRSDGNVVLDIGASDTSPYPGWIQVSDASDLSIEYPLLLNPNGGNVGIGTTSPAFALSVIGASNPAIQVADSTSGTGSGDGMLLQMADANGYLWNYENGFIQFATNNTAKMTILTGGNVGIGTTGPGQELEINGQLRYVAATADNQTWQCRNSSGDLAGCTSLLKHKEDIKDLSLGLDTILQLRPVTFNWKSSGNSDFGFIAEEVAIVDPLLATYDTEGNLSGVKIPQLSALAIKGIQQQQGQIASLSEQLAGLTLTDTGNLEIVGTRDEALGTSYSIKNTVGEIIDRVGAFGKVIAANIKVGRIETEIISPVANADLIIDLQPDNSQVATQLVIKGENDEIVTSFDAEGNATISGTLYADKIESERLSDIEELLREVETNQTLLAEAASWNVNTASDSANLATYYELHATNLFVTGQAAISSLFISDNFTTKNINSLTEPLSIQSLASAPLEIMAGKIIIDTNGNTKFLGNVHIAGDLTINNIIVASQEESLVASVSGEINTNATAGTATLTAGLAELKIVNSKVKANSLIYITPVTSTQNKVLYVKSKDIGQFTIGFNEAIDTNVEFNWWIIELQ